MAKPSLKQVADLVPPGIPERVFELSSGSKEFDLKGMVSIRFFDTYEPNRGMPTLVVSIFRQDPDVVVMVDGHDVVPRNGAKS